MTAFFHAHPYAWHALRGAVVGAVAAAETDRSAFVAWSSWKDVATFSWGVFSFRVAKGALIGAFGADGLQALFGG